MSVYDAFAKIIVDELSNILLKGFEENKKDLGEVARNFLFEIEGPTSLNGNFSIRQKHIYKLFKGFSEIVDSKDNLKDISYYMAVYPYQNKNLSRSRNLVYHIENYFNEIYILKMRLLEYSKIIARSYRNEISQNPKDFYEKINLEVVRTLSCLTEIRGKHVHIARYEHDDLRRLHQLQMFARHQEKNNEMKLWGDYFNFKYRETRTKWKKTFIANNENIIKLLNRYFEKLIPIISENYKFKYPTKML
ncbi:MAG: hypothetical protein WC209_18380 [Ignavibacteriaceae bacterium]|jgi:hypothetical protein